MPASGPASPANLPARRAETRPVRRQETASGRRPVTPSRSVKPAKANLLDKFLAYFAPQRALKRVSARARWQIISDYRAAETSRLRSDWVFGKSEATASSLERNTMRERSRDLNRNDPVASGATDTMALNIVGQGLQPQSRMRAEYLNISEEEAKDLRRRAELIWHEWKPAADAADRLDFDEIQFLALRKIVEDGEIIALPVMVADKWRAIKRCVELIEADRLDTTNAKRGPGATDSAIEVGERGQPLKYWIRKADHKGTGTVASVGIAARDSKGRPKVLHVFPAKRPGQLRGVPWFAPVMTYFKDLADTVEAEVVAARVSACLAVFVTIEDPSYGAYGRSDDTETSTSNRLQTLEPGMVDYLKPGESINQVDPKRPGDTFAPFVEMVLRMIGVSLNLPYELLVKDFSKTNYSSARAALLEGRRMFMTWRGWLARKFCQPIWELVLEEAFLRGHFDAPDFYRYRAEYCRATWLGGGWGWVDPVKEVDAARKAIDYGLSTLADEAAAQGKDWEEVLKQRKREEDKIGELGLQLYHSGKSDAGDVAAAVADEEEARRRP